MLSQNINERHLMTIMGLVFVTATILLAAPLLHRVVGIATMCISAYGTKWNNFMPAGLVQDGSKLVPPVYLFLFAIVATIGIGIGESLSRFN